MKLLNEFIEELEYNKKINIKENIENRIDIDYVIERLKYINKEIKGENKNGKRGNNKF